MASAYQKLASLIEDVVCNAPVIPEGKNRWSNTVDVKEENFRVVYISRRTSGAPEVSFWVAKYKAYDTWDVLIKISSSGVSLESRNGRENYSLEENVALMIKAFKFVS